MKKYIFYHICLINNYKEIVREQLRLIKSSGLYDDIECIYLCILGDDCNTLMGIFKEEGIQKISIVHCNEDIRQFEFPCLDSIRLFSQWLEEDSYILYIHAKAVSQPDTTSKDHYSKNCFRKALEYFVIKHYQKCIEKLKYVDIVGSFYQCIPGKVHFMGNYWWCHSHYLKTLPLCSQLPGHWWQADLTKTTEDDISSINSLNRIICEYWVCLNNPRALGFFSYSTCIRTYPIEEHIYRIFD